jgi:clan AA aspartic protease
MIAGVVTADLDAIILLTLLGPDGGKQSIEAVVDTGFSGFLTLPPTIVFSLELTWLCRQAGILADGREEWFDVYSGRVLWDGEPRSVEVEAADATPLIGMAILSGHELNIQVLVGGEVSIAKLP